MLGKYKVIAHHFCFAFLFLIAFTASPSQSAAAAKDHKGNSEILLTRTVASGGTVHTLRLWREVTPGLTLRQVMLMKRPPPFLPQNPGIPALGRAAYLLTDTVAAIHLGVNKHLPIAQARAKPTILFAGYRYGSEEIPPFPIYCVDFAVRSGTGDIYVVMTKSIMMHVQFFVFKASLKKLLGPFPFTFTVKNVNHWPKSPPAIAENKETLKNGFCGIALIRVFLRGSSLLIYGRREDPKCPAVYIKYELNKRAWRDITSKKEIAVINKLVESANKRNHALRGK